MPRWGRRRRVSPTIFSWRPICSRCGWKTAALFRSRNARSSAPPAPRCTNIPASRRANSMLNKPIEPPHPHMYRYDEFDAQFVRERVDQFAGQVARRLSGELTEDQFKPLRLMNGLYLQLHAYMLRIAVPYGTLA